MYGKLNEDGTLQSANKQHDGFIPLEDFETGSDGKYYEFYNTDGTPDSVAIQAKADADTAQANLEALKTTDKDMIRIAEDLISALVDKGLIAETDLPADAQAKLANRRTARAKL